MDSSTACHELREPGVIDESMIYNAIIEQGPRGEEGRLFKEQGINYEEIEHLRLEFLDILKIDHLWMMTGLTKLQLCNNIIEEIENLEKLTELKELDLSFNNISQIKNLDALTKLEVLTLFENKIEEIENLDHLNNLSVLSVGNNKISDFKNVIYLRGFTSLKSLNMAGNPICEDENFVSHVISYLPQLVYYEYKMIREGEKLEARQLYLHDLVKLEREEAELKEIEEAHNQYALQEKINEEAFVDGMGHDELFSMMFENDADGRTLLLIGDTVTDIYNEYKQNFLGVTREILRVGLEQAGLRKAELEEFNKCITKAMARTYIESNRITENFLEQKEEMFNEIKIILGSEEEDDDAIAELSAQLQAVNENFQDLCHKTWNQLMKKELHFFEACEDINSTFERSLTELVNQFVEGAQTLFTQLRQLQGMYNESVTDHANKFFTLYTVANVNSDAEKYPPELSAMMHDREILINALAASHDMHMLVIDQREDKLISGVRNWLANFMDKLTRSEIERNRRTVTEINHFLTLQRAELDEITSSQLGLLLLPNEVQDVLQIA